MDFPNYGTREQDKDLMEQLTFLGQLLVQKEAEREDAHKALSIVESEIKDLTEKRMPAIMAALAMSEFTLETGQKFKSKDQVFVSLSEENRPKGLQWLEENGHDAIIKNSVIASFSKGDNAMAVELLTRLQEQGYDVDAKRGVHAGTLKKLIKELLAEGKKVPEFFNAHQRKVVEVAKPKKVRK